MATIPTQNPVPSEAAIDLKFNAGKIDEFVTSFLLKYTDRLGREHLTIEGIRDIVERAIKEFGWVTRDSFEIGATLDNSSEVLRWESNSEYYRWDGAFPKVVPSGSTPATTGGIGIGAWVGIGDASLRSDLISSSGGPIVNINKVTVSPQGNLSQSINWVTPEQFGAIGDGTVHPLSERYATLAAAQAVYPHVTSLTQTIDWAACQGAENYARGKFPVRCPFFARYHFGDSNYLELGINSKWFGGVNVNRDSGGTRMIRTIPSSKPFFGQDCVVRVMDATKAGSSDEFVRGIVFDGFVLDRGTKRRAASKGTGAICFHANYGMGMTLGLIAFGAEYGVFGYSFWASTGWLKIDSCHKAFWADATLITPENPSVPSGAVNTTFDFDVRIDACVFGLVLNRVKYSKFTGYIEGIAVSTPSVEFPIYDSDNETAIAITAVRCDSIDVTEMGIEYWEGVHVYSNESTISINMSWTQDKLLKNTTGKHGPYQAISQLTNITELFTLPSTNNSYYYSVNRSLLTLRNMTGDMTGAQFANTFLVTVDGNARFLMMNTGVYFGSSRLIAPANWVNIECINDPFMPNYLVPDGYSYEGRGICTARTWSLKAINGGDGKVALQYGAEIPTGWELIDWTVHIVTGTQAQASSIGMASVTINSVTFQTNVTATGFSIQYKLRLRVVK
ncbi:hypothetical protein [Yersinia kristensenii]|uniref:tail fiber/spike domain-containing protein n=1 Tax=Yersinia kristensenii TaxID=28152 RepID=UPI0005E79DDB|nr:hypothetical protein [Yersinia kristensenii]CNE41965.1 Uncharacterised protein [Yersinia kristensenii]